VLKEKHKFMGSIHFQLISKGESCRQGEKYLYSWESCRQGDKYLYSWENCRQGENYFFAWWTMCFNARFPSMTKGKVVGIIVIDVKGLMLPLTSYSNITIHTTLPRLIYIYIYIYIDIDIDIDIDIYI
jgi:hypothetical protein